MDLLKVYLFNVPRFEYQGIILDIPRRKSIALVAYLAFAQQPQSRDTIAALLWPDLNQEHARGALRSTMYSLTKLFSDELFIATRNTIFLNKHTIWVDVREFLALLAQRRLHPHHFDNTCAECIELLKQALNLYHGNFLDGFTLSGSADYDNWQGFQQDVLCRECGEVLRQLAEYYGDKSLGDYGLALDYAHRWLTLNPFHEPAHRLLMSLFAASGQRVEALRQYQECVTLLNDELATVPEAETITLYEELRTEQRIIPQRTLPALMSGTLPPVPMLIVGREKVLRDLKERLGIAETGKLHPVTVIQGWPGVGKSTLVAALAHDPDLISVFPDGVLWTSLGEKTNLLTELFTWAKALKLVDVQNSFGLEEITVMLTTTLRDKRMLLIVDDVWRAEHVAPFRVGGQKCGLIMTSRLNDVARSLAPTAHDVYRLSILAEESALELLAVLAPQAVIQYPQESRELVRSLEGLPLGIQVAGRLLDSEMQFGWGVKDLLIDLHEGVRLLQAQVPGDMVGWRPETPPTIAVLLQRSTDALDDLTRQRFADLGLFVPKPATFDLDAMAALWDVTDPKPTARILLNRGLLEPLSGGRFQMHALLMLHARSLLLKV